MMTMTIERNEKGQLLLDPVVLAKEAAQQGGSFSRYNGGWIKSITKLDKSQTNGYSLVGEFVKQGLQWLSPGVYLDCSISGSRKNQVKSYTVFKLEKDGSVKLLGTAGDSRDWAVKLWPVIESGLNDVENVADPQAKLQELLERKDKLEKELDLVNEQIKLLAIN